MKKNYLNYIEFSNIKIKLASNQKWDKMFISKLTKWALKQAKDKIYSKFWFKIIQKKPRRA